MNQPPLRLIAEQGKDWGLSIVGSKEQMLELAAALQRAADVQGEHQGSNGLVDLVAPAVVSPYHDRPHFYLAFCVTGSGGMTRVAMQQIRSGPSGPVLLTIAALCLIGLAATIRVVLNVL